MSARQETIDITPDKSLMPKLASAGYSFVQAVSELVDNSIDARSEGQRLRIKIDLGRDHIQVLDDGKGMSRREAAACLKLAYSEKQGKLGEFGLGLKTACLSLGRRFKVWTTTEGPTESYLIEFDEDRWSDPSSKWTDYPLTVLSKKSPESHGTTVKVDRLKVKTLGRTTNLRETLAVRFAPFILSGEIQIEVNRKICKPIEPILTDEGKTHFDFNVSGNRVYGWYGLLREGSQRGLYGFNTFRRGRLITAFTKIGFDEHPTVARIVGEIHMDQVPVTHNKREWIVESPEYIAVEARLRQELSELVRRARAKASEENVTRSVREKTQLWLDKISEAMQQPELRIYGKPLNPLMLATDERSDNSEDPVKILDVEKRAPGEAEGTIEPAGTDRERTPRKVQERPVHVIEVRGKKFRFTHEFRPLGAKAEWKEYRLDPEVGLEIFTNTDFPAFLVTNDRSYYAAYHVAESIAEVLVTESKEPVANVGPLKQTILRNAATLMSQL
jgi:hypothetical protein